MNTTPTEQEPAAQHTKRTALNWAMAISTSIGALAIVVYAYLQVLASAACSPATCSGVGPSETVFGLIEYGVPVVAVVVILLSFATARQPYGIVVPVVAWVLIIAAAVVLFTSF
jgi:hypothetical protein